MIDSLLPKAEQKQRVIELYRSRAVVRTALLGSLLNPFLFLFEATDFDLLQKTGIVLMLTSIPLSLVWIYRSTGWLKLCGGLYLAYCTILCSWAQLAAGTVHAFYWVWIPFLIVFSVLVLGVKIAAGYAAATILVFAWILHDNSRHGHTLGRFPDPDALLASMALQILLIQI